MEVVGKSAFAIVSQDQDSASDVMQVKAPAVLKKDMENASAADRKNLVGEVKTFRIG
jgi:hypothetical protein